MNEKNIEVLNFPSEFEKIYEIDSSGQKLFKLLIDGKWRKSKSGKFFDVRSPATTNVIYKVSEGTKEDAYEATCTAQES